MSAKWASLGTCDVPSVQGERPCFSGGPGQPGAWRLAALLQTIVGGAALGPGARRLGLGSLVAGQSRWPSSSRLARVPQRTLLVGGSLLATVGSLVVRVAFHPPAHTPAGRGTLFSEKPHNTQRVLTVGASLSTQHDNEALFRERPL